MFKLTQLFLKRAVFLLALVSCATGLTVAQTNLNGGTLSGKLRKMDSPYTVMGTINIPLGKTLTIESGVEILFDSNSNLIVHGSIQALGTNDQPIRFTASDTSKGWKGIFIHKNEEKADSNLFDHCEFSYNYQITPDAFSDYGAFHLDTVNNIRFSHCTFNNNTAFNAACFRVIYGKLRIDNCWFLNNQALDTNVTHPNNTNGPGGSCLFSEFCDLTISNSRFEGNRSIAPNYLDQGTEQRAGFMVACNGNRVRVTNCKFEGNHADAGRLISYTGYYWKREQKLDSFWFLNNKVIGNTINDNYVLSLDFTRDDPVKAFVRNTVFERNKCLNRGKGTVIFCYNPNGGKNDILIDNCKLIDNEMSVGVRSYESTWLNFANSSISGQKGDAFFTDRTTKTTISNSVINNNWGGVYAFFNNKLDIVNSVIAYNGRIDTTQPYPETYKNTHAFHRSFGIFVADRGQVDLFNSIVTGNKNHLGGMANMIAVSRYVFPNRVYNSIIEGGIDSTYRQPVSPPWVQVDSVPFSVVSNFYTKPPEFINPPKGVGVDFNALDLDFRIKESCDTSLVINKGLDFFNEWPNDVWPDNKDKNGNQRVQCGTIDIGPYEAKGQKGYTYLERPWLNGRFCKDKVSAFNPLICGYDIDYTWQSSDDGSTWSDLPSTDYDENKLVNPKETNYRVITYQKECNVLDTFGPRSLEILEIPNPNLGMDTTIYANDTLWLAPGNFPKYDWSYTNDDDSVLMVAGYRYRTVGSRYFWVDVTADNGCVVRDSILITFISWNSSVKDIATQGIIIYPNPASNKLYIDLPNHWQDEMTVRVVDNHGKLTKYVPIRHGESTIDISHLSPGIYTLQLEINGEVLSKKFIKN